MSNFTPTLVKKSVYEKQRGVSLRHVIFHKGKELEEAGVICRFGRHWMVDPKQLEDYIRGGNLKEIGE